MYLLLNVDDIIIIGPNMKIVYKIKIELAEEFEMKDL